MPKVILYPAEDPTDEYVAADVPSSKQAYQILRDFIELAKKNGLNTKGRVE